MTTTDRTPPPCPSDYQLDLWLAEELTPRDQVPLRLHLASCAHCTARLERASAEQERLPQQRPLPASPAAEILAPVVPLRPRRRPARWFVPGGAGLAMAAGVALLLARGEPPARSAAPTTRSKGGFQVDFVVARAGARDLEPHAGQPAAVQQSGQRDAEVRPGDRIQLLYSSPRPGHLAVLGRDGSGATAIYYPAGGAPEPVPAGQRVPLSHSIALDAVPGQERLYVLFCTAPVALEPLRARLAGDGTPGEPPPGCELRLLVLDKVIPPGLTP
jgi:hypothetical protein